MKYVNRTLFLAVLSILYCSTTYSAHTAIREFKSPGHYPKHNPALATLGLLTGFATPFVGIWHAKARLDTIYTKNLILYHAGESRFHGTVSTNTSAAALLLKQVTGNAALARVTPKEQSPESIDQLAQAYLKIRRADHHSDSAEIQENIAICDQILGGNNETLHIHNKLVDTYSDNYSFYKSMIFGSKVSSLIAMCVVIHYKMSFTCEEPDSTQSNVHVFTADENEFLAFLENVMHKKLNKDDLD